MRTQRPTPTLLAAALTGLTLAACDSPTGTSDGRGPGGQPLAADPSTLPTAAELFEPVAFPDDFLWGAASSAYQIEGNYDPDIGPLESNWSRWEEMGKVSHEQTNPRGANYYETWPEDLQRHADLGLETTRIGISWERIEPENDQWNQAGIDYYVAMLKRARELGIEPMVTFYHWVVPRWISDPALPRDDPGRDRMGVPGNEFVWNEFAEFVGRVVPEIAPYVDLYSITNEPWSMIAGGYLAGQFPPGDVINFPGMQALHSNLVFMTARAADRIRANDTTDADGDGRPARIGVAKAAAKVLPLDPSVPADRRGAKRIEYIFNRAFVDALTVGRLDVNWDGDADDKDTVPPEGHYPDLAGTLDWIGINYYGPTYVVGNGADTVFNAIPVPFGGGADNYPISEIGMELRPAGLVATLEFFWRRYELPMFITENGIADCDDDQRQRYLVEHLYAMGRAMAVQGMEIEGYYQWSLVDNFEWAHGFDQCFGLYAVDFEDDFRRTLRESGAAYADVAAANGIDFAAFMDAYEAGYGTIPGAGRSAAEVLKEIAAEVNNGPDKLAIP